MYVKTNLNDAEMKAYNSAATVLNEYVETHQVLASRDLPREQRNAPPRRVIQSPYHSNESLGLSFSSTENK